MQQHNSKRWIVRVKIAALSFYAPPSAILSVQKLLEHGNALPVTLDHNPTPDELQQIARSKLQQLQQEVDSYLHALDPKFYAPLDVFGVHVEEVKA